MTKNKQTFNISQTAEILVPDKLGRTSYLIAICQILLMIVIIGLVYTYLPNRMPIFFTLPWGEARLGPKILMFLLPLLPIIFIVFNLGLGRISDKLSPLLPRVLAVSSAVVAFMMFIALFGILQSIIL